MSPVSTSAVRRYAPVGQYRIGFLSLLLAVLVSGTQMTRAQQPADSVNPPLNASKKEADAPVGVDERYRIGPEDVLDIRVFNKPQLSREMVRVDNRGMIRMPLLEQEIQAACLTEGELAQEVSKSYHKYLKNPQVDVFVKEYQSQPVAVLGAVNSPGRFQLRRRVRLSEILSFANGPSERAGRTVLLLRAPQNLKCGNPEEPVETEEAAAAVLTTFDLGEITRGGMAANPFVRPGDTVNVPEAKQVYITGNVVRPIAIDLKEKLTVSRAIAIAGGLLPDSKSEKLLIARQLSGNKKTEILVNMKLVNKHEAEDVELEPGDIVDVPTASGKRMFRTLLGSVIPSVGQLPVRVIP